MMTFNNLLYMHTMYQSLQLIEVCTLTSRRRRTFTVLSAIVTFHNSNISEIIEYT